MILIFKDKIVCVLKVELYIYIEGLFEFELIFVFVQCNGVKFVYDLIDVLCVVYVFIDL